MKKISLIALFAALVAVNINATDLFVGSHAVTWETPLNFEAAKFADAKAGDKIVVTYTDAAHGIEFKIPEVWDHMAGSREAAWINGAAAYEQFITEKALEQLKANGLQIVGENFTCTKVELLDGRVLKEGVTVWAGFFWADEWSTLELYKEGYNTVDFSKATALRIYSEAGRSDFVINVILNAWPDKGGENVANQEAMTAGEGYMELPLTDELRTKLAEASKWMIQFNKETGNPFNVTDIVLVMEDTADGIANTAAQAKTVKMIENGQIVIINNGVRYNALGAQL